MLDSQEITLLSSLEKRVQNFHTDILVTSGDNVSAKLNHLTNEVKAFVISTNTRTGLDDEAVSRINQLKTNCKALIRLEREAEREAEELTNAHRSQIESERKYIDYFSKTLIERASSDSDLKENAHTPPLFNRSRALWNNISSKLELLNSQHNLQRLRHNSLSATLLPSDDEFLEELSMRGFDCEIANIAINRLIPLASKSKNKEIMKRAKLAIQDLAFSSENIFQYDHDELKNELTKLSLFAKVHPTNKVIWLGSARSVHSMIAHANYKACYLNCDDTKWTYELNRAWLSAGSKLGYKMILVEHQFPDMQEAMLSGDVAKYLCQLISEIRDDGDDLTSEIKNQQGVVVGYEKKDSQYNGKDAPTATCQEVLALLDFGCTASKNKEGNVIFSLLGSTRSPSKDDSPDSKRNCVEYLKRSHSISKIYNVCSKPLKIENGKPSAHFSRPKASTEIRQDQGIV